jgi:hypothetical protein
VSEVASLLDYYLPRQPEHHQLQQRLPPSVLWQPISLIACKSASVPPWSVFDDTPTGFTERIGLLATPCWTAPCLGALPGRRPPPLFYRRPRRRWSPEAAAPSGCSSVAYPRAAASFVIFRSDSRQIRTRRKT